MGSRSEGSIGAAGWAGSPLAVADGRVLLQSGTQRSNLLGQCLKLPCSLPCPEGAVEVVSAVGDIQGEHLEDTSARATTVGASLPNLKLLPPATICPGPSLLSGVCSASLKAVWGQPPINACRSPQISPLVLPLGETLCCPLEQLRGMEHQLPRSGGPQSSCVGSFPLTFCGCSVSASISDIGHRHPTSTWAVPGPRRGGRQGGFLSASSPPLPGESGPAH